MTAPLEVPINELDWYTFHRRKLIGRITVSTVAAQELAKNTETIGELLAQARGSTLHVAQPDHVSLFKYGRKRDNLDLSAVHRNNVAGIMQSHLVEADMAAVMLDRLVVGSSYSKPLAAAA